MSRPTVSLALLRHHAALRQGLALWLHGLSALCHTAVLAIAVLRIPLPACDAATAPIALWKRRRHLVVRYDGACRDRHRRSSVIIAVELLAVFHRLLPKLNLGSERSIAPLM